VYLFQFFFFGFLNVFVKKESLDWMRFLHALFSGLAVFSALSIRHGMISVFGLGNELAE